MSSDAAKAEAGYSALGSSPTAADTAAAARRVQRQGSLEQENK